VFGVTQVVMSACTTSVPCSLISTTTSCTADPRTRKQLRADAMGALAAGADRLTCRCGQPPCSAAVVRTREPPHPTISGLRTVISPGRQLFVHIGSARGKVY
jgi:hypothetical protein